MDLPNFKDILKKLLVLKNNMTLLVSIGITIIALLLFIPTRLLSGRLRSQIERGSLSLNTRVNREIRNPVSKDLPDALRSYTDQIARDANQVQLLAMQSTQRELLSYRIFPEPNDPSPMLLYRQFARNFQQGIDQMLVHLNAKECPTVAEIQQSISSLSSGGRRGLTGGGYSRPSTRIFSGMNLGLRGMRNFGEAELAIVNGVLRGRAESCSVYANAVDIAGYNYWRSNDFSASNEEILKDCWSYQLAYWITEDVVDAIAAINAGSTNALTAPVKRLSRLGYVRSTQRVRNQRLSRRRRPQAINVNAGDKPSYVTTALDGLAESLTGRMSDDQLDVVHFNLTIILDQKYMLPFMNELCSAKEHVFKGFSGQEPAQRLKHNQISILESMTRSVDPTDVAHSLYRYGDDPVVELELVCEYVFNKKAYEAIQPKLTTDSTDETF